MSRKNSDPFARIGSSIEGAAGPDGFMGLERTKSGWMVYSCERGAKVPMANFSSESDAREYLAKEIQNEVARVNQRLATRKKKKPNKPPR